MGDPGVELGPMGIPGKKGSTSRFWFGLIAIYRIRPATQKYSGFAECPRVGAQPSTRRVSPCCRKSFCGFSIKRPEGPMLHFNAQIATRWGSTSGFVTCRHRFDT